MIDELRPEPQVEWWCDTCKQFHKTEYVPYRKFVPVEDEHEVTIRGREDDND